MYDNLSLNGTVLSFDENTIKQVKAIEDLRSYISTLPFDDYDMKRLIKSVNDQLHIIEFGLQQQVGKKEIERYKEMEK